MFKYNEFLNEMEFNMIPTEYEIKKKYHMNRLIEEYVFTTTNYNDYSIYFMLTEEDDCLLPNNQLLSRYTELDKIPTIFFSLTERPMDLGFNDLTNKNEFMEVMGKVIFIIRQYMDTHTYDVYSYDTDTDKQNNFYNYYRKSFKDFLKVTLPSKNYYSNGNKKNINYLIKDYQRFIFEAKYVDFGDNFLLLPWSNREEALKLFNERKYNNG